MESNDFAATANTHGRLFKSLRVVLWLNASYAVLLLAAGIYFVSMNARHRQQDATMESKSISKRAYLQTEADINKLREQSLKAFDAMESEHRSLVNVMESATQMMLSLILVFAATAIMSGLTLRKLRQQYASAS